nr:6-carboxyhexanoate--CoA ligase [Bacillus subtilis]
MSGVRCCLIFIQASEWIKQKKKGCGSPEWIGTDANFEKWALHSHVPAHSRIKEYLALASKVSRHPAAIAELCWSDDPDYITGYVAGKKMGYQRITAMKEYGTEEGCRVFFIDGSNDVNTYIHDLEKQPILIEWEEDHDS